MVDFRAVDVWWKLDKWREENSLTLQQLESTIGQLVRNSEFKRGYHQAERDWNLKMARQAAIERNDGKEPDYHHCHFCGTYVANGYESDGKRHYLSDCRPDLVEHEIGPTCTWHGLTDKDGDPIREYDCYAYQDTDSPGLPWTNEHKFFYPDGPM